MSKLQDILISSIQKVGSVIEKTAQLGSKQKVKKTKKSGLTDKEGQDFSEIPWDEKHLQNLLSGSEHKEIVPLIPSLVAKKTLHLTTSRERFVEAMEKRGAQGVVELDVAKTNISHQAPMADPGHPYARGTIDHLPFSDDSFDFILYPSALTWRTDLPILIPEISRCIKDGGRVVLSIIHPFFEYLMNPRNGFKKHLDVLFENMKREGFFIEELKEGALEDALRNVSLPQKMVQDFKKYPGLPLVLAVKALRLRKKKKS